MTCQNSGKHLGKMIDFCSMGIFYKITGNNPGKKEKRKLKNVHRQRVR